ncbi:MAG: Rid family hydrolase [Alteraurantiacibacter sp.]
MSLNRRAFAARLAVTIACATASPAVAQGEVIRIQRNPQAIILEAARVNAGADMVYLSGQLASPLDPAMPMSAVTTIEQMGDTRQQTISTLGKIRDILATQGFTMADVIKLTLFVAADPRTGAMDFAGANAGFREFFGTAENPGTVARSTFQVAALVGPLYLIEIEAIAARAPTAD